MLCIPRQIRDHVTQIRDHVTDVLLKMFKVPASKVLKFPKDKNHKNL